LFNKSAERGSSKRNKKKKVRLQQRGGGPHHDIRRRPVGGLEEGGIHQGERKSKRGGGQSKPPHIYKNRESRGKKERGAFYREVSSRRKAARIFSHIEAWRRESSLSKTNKGWRGKAKGPMQ